MLAAWESAWYSSEEEASAASQEIRIGWYTLSTFSGFVCGGGGILELPAQCNNEEDEEDEEEGGDLVVVVGVKERRTYSGWVSTVGDAMDAEWEYGGTSFFRSRIPRPRSNLVLTHPGSYFGIQPPAYGTLGLKLI